MPAFKSDRHAGLTAFPQVTVPPADWGGKLFGIFDTYTATGDETAGSTILLGRIRPGDRLVAGYLQHGACGAGVTVKIGVAGDDDRILAAASVASAGRVSFTAVSFSGWRNATNDPQDVIVTTAGGTMTAGAVLTLSLSVQNVG